MLYQEKSGNPGHTDVCHLGPPCCWFWAFLYGLKTDVSTGAESVSRKSV
jgi:hypothetical protein